MTAASDTPTLSRTRRAASTTFLLVACCALGIGALLFVEVYSLDAWWQVAIGRSIIENRAVPRVDSFSQAGGGRPYHDSHWLFQVALATADRIDGMAGTGVVAILAWAVVFVVCSFAAAKWTGGVPSALLVYAAAMASSERFLPRPEIVTYLMLALFLFLFAGKRPPRPLLLLLLQAVWTNSHGLFVLGPFVSGCFLAAGFRKRKQRPALLKAFAAVVAGSFLSPYGIGSWLYAFRLATEVGPNAPRVLATLGELASPFGHDSISSPAFWFYLFLLAGSLISVVLALRTIPRGMLLVAPVAALLSFTGRRNIVLLAITAVFVIAPALGRRFHPGTTVVRVLSVVVPTAILLFSLYPLSGRYYLDREIPARAGLSVTPSFFPHALVKFMRARGIRGDIYNSNTIGGFLSYHGFRPLTDGRWEIYDQRELLDILDSPRDLPTFLRMLDTRHLQWLVFQHAAPETKQIVPAAIHLPWFRLVAYDTGGSLWRYRADGFRSKVGEVVSLVPKEGLRLDDRLLLDRFFRSAGMLQEARANLLDAVPQAPNPNPLLVRLGGVELKLGRYDAAERTYSQLLSKDPDSIEALNELAYLASREKRYSQALHHLERALDLQPQDADLQQNYARVRTALARSTGRSESPAIPRAAGTPEGTNPPSELPRP